MAAQFGSATWVISPEESSQNEVVFNNLKPNAGKISGEQAKKYLMMSNLPTPVLGHIWTLSDMDNDGKMSFQEFNIALHLVQAKRRGIEIPKVLPYSLKSSSVPKKSVFDSGFSTPSSSMMPLMNNGSIGAPAMSSGGILTPLPMGQSGISGSFSSQSHQTGFHTGYSGSNTFPRNMPAMHLSNSTPQFQNQAPGMSSLDTLTSLSSGWGQAKDASFQSSSHQRASSLNIKSQTMPQSSLSSLSSLQFGMSAPLATSSNVRQPSPLGQPASFGQHASLGQSASLGQHASLGQPASFGQHASLGPAASVGQPASVGIISPSNKMKYTQMFKAADNAKNGFLRGEQARQILIQSGISPDKLAKIWDLSDVNKDGNLDLEEFTIAMHLIETVKSGQPVPASLPQGLAPAGRSFNEPELIKTDIPIDGGRARSESVSSIGKLDAVTFEDRRKDNFEKGRLELERRRKEIQDRRQREKEERERKDREEEEKKRKIREDSERRRLQQLENERRQNEEMEREQEDQRRKLIEQRHAAQLEAERQRQREWENRRKEELLNQKGLEEDIVTGLKLRLEKLKGELNQETIKRDGLATDLNSRKINFNELISSITQLNKSREFGAVQINMFNTDIKKMTTLVSQLKEERERLNVEINKRDSNTTSEALGGVRASIQQTKASIPRLKSHLLAIEAETDNLLKENDVNARQMPPIKAALQIKIDENSRYKHHQEQKKRDYQIARQRFEDEARRLDAINRQKREEEDKLKRQAEARLKKEEMALQQREDERRKQKAKEQKAMQLEQQRQEESMRRIQQAQAAEKQSKMAKAKQITKEALQKQQELKIQQPLTQSSRGSAAKPDTASLFTASKDSSVVNADLLGLDSSMHTSANVALPAPPKREKRPVAPPRPKTRPVVSTSDKLKPKLEEVAKNDNWNALAELDSDRRKEEEDVMKQLKEKAEELQLEEEQRLKREEEVRRIQEEGKKKEEARKKLEEEKRKRDEALQRKKEEEKRKGEAERRRWEEELRVKEEMELEKQKRRQEEARKKGEAERKRWEEEQQRIEIERQKEEEAERKRQEEQRIEEDEKRQKEAEVRRKVEEMQRMKQLKKQQQQEKEQSPKTSESEYQPTTHIAKPASGKQKPRYKVLFPFEARHADELTLDEGDIVQVDEEHTTVPGWFFGTKAARSGLFPTNYVEKLPNDTFSDYVDLDKNATAPMGSPATVNPSASLNASAPMKASVPIKASVPVNASVPIDTPSPTQGPKKALLPKPRPLSKLVQNTAPEPLPKPSANRPRTGSQLETVLENERRSSYGSSEGTDGSSSVTGGGSSVKSIASAFDKHDCYENVQPPTSLEGPSSSEVAFKAPEGLQAVALYPYRGKKDDHLSFNKNDQIIVQEQQDLWWYGECNNKIGWFPKSYVKVIGTIKTPILMHEEFCDASSVASSTSSVATEYSGGEHNFVGECVAIFDYSGIDGDLAFNEGDTIKITKKESDWWEGVLRGECGFFPANYVKVKETVEAPKKPEVATVISAFVASDGKEISLNPGQLIHVLKKDPGGWWQGELQARGKKRQVGWFPATCVKLLAQTKTPEQVKPTEKPMIEQADDDIYDVPPKRETPADQVLALFSYTAQNEDELTFYKGSVINVIKKEGDWWKGELNGQVGMFPFNYVQLLTDLPDNSGQ